MDCGIKELWSWGTIGSGQNNGKWDVRIKMFGFFYYSVLERKCL